MTPHLTEDDLLLHYYGETDPSREGIVAAHLGACAECRASLVGLERLLAMVNSGVDVDLPQTFERDIWRRLAPHVVRPHASVLWSTVLTPRWLAWGAAAAGVVLAVLLVVQLRLHGPSPRKAADEGPHRAPATADVFRERVLLADLENHFERSEMMLVELVNTSHYTPAEIQREQARAEDLLAANRLYRQTAANVGNAPVAHVLEELERLLVDVAASSPTAAAADLEVLGRRTESQSLIFKVRVLSRSTDRGFEGPSTQG
ncbi:MAG: hypothetical protein GEU99_25140 [Luteitalea sp.]|nr:hypothetical protein [Luteitalea sp.]